MTFSPQLEERFAKMLASYPEGRKRSAVVPMLIYAQDETGAVTKELIEEVAKRCAVTPLQVDEVVGYYSMLHRKPQGKYHVQVCTNISCWMRGGDELLDAFRVAADGADDVFVTGFECLGACDIAPMASIDERYFGPLEAAEATTAIEQLLAGADVLPAKALEQRPLAGDAGA